MRKHPECQTCVCKTGDTPPPLTLTGLAAFDDFDDGFSLESLPYDVKKRKQERRKRLMRPRINTWERSPSLADRYNIAMQSPSTTLMGKTTDMTPTTRQVVHEIGDDWQSPGIKKKNGYKNIIEFGGGIKKRKTKKRRKIKRRRKKTKRRRKKTKRRRKKTKRRRKAKMGMV